MRKSLLTKLGLGLLILLVILAGLVIGARLVLGGSLGRSIVVSQLEGRQLGSLGTLHIEGLTGDLFSDLSLERVSLEDEDGVWLIAENVSLNWRARDLLSNAVHVDRFNVQTIHVLRRPKGAESPSEPRGALSLPHIHLEAALIETLVLEEPVLGQRAQLHVEAALTGFLQSPGTTTLRIERLDEADEFLRLNAQRTPEGDITADLHLEAPAQGPLAHLLRMPERALIVEGALRGDLQAGTGDLSARLDGEAVSQARITWQDKQWEVIADSALAPWPQIPDTASAFGERAALSLKGPMAKPYITGVEAHLDHADITISREDAATPWQGQVDVTGPALRALIGDTLTVERAHLDGVFALKDAPLFDGVLSAEGVEGPKFTLASLSGPTQIERRDGGYHVVLDWQLTRPRTEIERVNPLLGQQARVQGEADWISAEKQARWQAMHLTSSEAEILTSGHYSLPTKTLDLESDITLHRSQSLHESLTGPVRAHLSAAGQAPDTLDLRLEIASDELRFADRMAALGTGLNGEIDGHWGEAGFEARSITLQSSQVRVEASGQAGRDGAWQTRGNIAFSGQTGIPSFDVNGALVAAFEARSTASGIAAQSVITTQAMSLGPVAITNPHVQIEAQWQSGQLDMLWLIFARHDRQDIAIFGSLIKDETGLHLTTDNGQIGVSLVDLSADLVEGQLTSRLGLIKNTGLTQWNGDFTLTGPIHALRQAQIEGEAHLTRTAFKSVIIDEGHITASGPLSGLSLGLNLEGRAGKAFTLAAPAHLVWAEDGPITLALRASGRWGRLKWQAQEPIQLQSSAEGRRLNTRLVMGGGHVTVESAFFADPQTPSFLRVEAEALPAQIFSSLGGLPMLHGTLQAQIDLQNPGAAWLGEAQIGLNDVYGADMPRESAITLHLGANLGEDLVVSGDLHGAELTGALNLTRTGPSPSLLKLAGDDTARLEGHARINGQIDALALLLLPENLRAQGQLDFQSTFTGPASDPHLTGSIALNDGEFQMASTGTHLQGLTFAADFDGTSMQIQTLEAHDGGEGRLSGSATLDLNAEGLSGIVNLTFDHLEALKRRDGEARLSGNIHLDLNPQRLNISGSSLINRLEARPPEASGPSITRLDVEEINAPEGLTMRTRTRLPINLDYRIHAPGDLFVSARSFNSEWRGDLHIGGTARKVNVQGSVNLIRGQAFLVNRPFAFKEGEVRFAGQPNNGRVHIVAEHRRTGFEAQITVDGRIREPEITLSSTPSLPQDEILSRLLFDRSAAQLTAFETAQLAAQLSGQNIFGALGSLRNMTGLDRLDISTGANGGVVVTGGHRVSDDVYIELESGDGTAFGAAKVEWTLSPDLSLLSRLTGDTNASIALQWQKEY
ncbi:translocation/assembly module TamB domain-containing protein [Woodsholea maritima]|uniref:translocation/assembly module TamB domain-containing protein n=1 Tax=Woodsholea maritima TaxID=240237 RepID=UPI0003690A36|nr:translocation/assembly module TamB domain-containing protein [Woodsholea maritima]